ncbi:DUF2062 domain-containing protein [Psychromonas sp. RZ22]|uniref:DUF2062 domain-containing protein n=1 Tax=Psychromonas algarum TaxID=2555643 RepID=UPI0010675F82|nr:DUF2062 domain-containing protein [Psychromonas sp. RZ22]TEW56004.1 DUF2062 domain-containing protein [Psychromonas sp. RZ22]
MPKKFIKRFSPNPETLKAHPHLKHFGAKLQNPNLWHLNRRSAAGAVAVGLFCAWVPMPFQMLLASIIAMIFCVNLPLSVALVWISNPLTMPPLFYAGYRLGAFILNQPLMDFHFELSYAWIINTLETIAPAMFLGCFIIGCICAFFGYWSFTFFWRYSAAKKWKTRQHSQKR